MSWETSSGRPTDYTGTVEEVTFTTDAHIKNGEEFAAFFSIKPDEGEEVETNEDGYVEETFTLGKGWKSNDGGESVTGNRKFNKNTRYGRLIDHTITELGSVEAASEFFGGDPTSAEIWLGMHATWSEVNYPYPDRENPGKTIDFYLNMPHEITKPGQQKASGAAAKGAAKKASPAAKAAGNGSGDVEGRLKKLAAALDYDDWMEQALKLPGVQDDDSMMARLADEAYYESLKG